VERSTASGISTLRSAKTGRTARLSALLGICASVLMIISYLLIASLPDAQSTDQEIRDFYADGNRRLVVIAGLYITPFSAIAFLWFIVVLRMWIASAARTARDALASNIQLVSGIVFIGLLLVSAGAIATPAAAYEFANAPVTPEVARQLPALGNTLLFVMAIRMGAMFILATSTIARQSALLPRWMWGLGYVIGVYCSCR
jgi:hypothetical protein